MGFDGSWTTVIQTPVGKQDASLVLKTDGNKLTGEMDSAMGTVEILDGRFEGSKATWTAQVSQPMSMKLEFSAQVAGDTIIGKINLGAFGNATFEGTRI